MKFYKHKFLYYKNTRNIQNITFSLETLDGTYLNYRMSNRTFNTNKYDMIWCQ